MIKKSIKIVIICGLICFSFQIQSMFRSLRLGQVAYCCIKKSIPKNISSLQNGISASIIPHNSKKTEKEKQQNLDKKHEYDPGFVEDIILFDLIFPDIMEIPSKLHTEDKVIDNDYDLDID